MELWQRNGAVTLVAALLFGVAYFYSGDWLFGLFVVSFYGAIASVVAVILGIWITRLRTILLLCIVQLSAASTLLCYFEDQATYSILFALAMLGCIWLAAHRQRRADTYFSFWHYAAHALPLGIGPVLGLLEALTSIGISIFLYYAGRKREAADHY